MNTTNAVKVTTDYFNIPEDAVSARLLKVENHEDRAIVMYEDDWTGKAGFLPRFSHGLDAYSLTRGGAQWTDYSDEEYRESIVRYTYPLETAQRIVEHINNGLNKNISAAAATMGRVKSKAKAEAARRNGVKGGRPKKSQD
jgi:hypothetical protein